MRAPMIVDSLQHLPDVIGKADLKKIHEELLKCLPSLPNITNLHKFKNELSTSLHALNFSSLSGWNVMEHVTKCLPEHFSLVSLIPLHGVSYMILFICSQIVMYFGLSKVYLISESVNRFHSSGLFGKTA